MIKKHVFVIFQGLIILLYFTNILKNGRGEDAIPVMGYQAIFLNAYYIIGNLLIIMIWLCAVLMIGLWVRYFIAKKPLKNADQAMTILTNLQLFAGMIFATFLGTFLAATGYVVIALIALSAYFNYLLNR